MSIAQGRSDAACLAVALAGALLGFLVYNFFPASIFLGDSGSLLLGYVLSILSIQGRGKSPTISGTACWPTSPPLPLPSR